MKRSALKLLLLKVCVDVALMTGQTVAVCQSTGRLDCLVSVQNGRRSHEHVCV